MTPAQTVNTLHRNLAQYFSLDELKLLCHDAGINPESVPYSERGIEIYAFCVVESFRHHEMLPALLVECAKLRGQIAWDTFIAETEVPTEWAELLSPQPSIGNLDARDSQGLSISNTGTLEQHFGDKINTQGGDVVYGPKTVGYTVEQVSALVNSTIAELTRERQPKPYDGRKPYPGLTAFRESDAPFFCGREEGVKQLLARIGANGQRFVCITGASGSGKSSLIRAGLIPQLKQGAVDGAAEWRYADFSPQGEPLTQLAHALARLTGLSDAGERFLKTYKNDADALSKVIAPALSSVNQKAVLFIDQFEELFTYKQDQPEDEAERRAFVSQITHDAQQANGHVIVLIALRSDFVSPCLAYPELSRLLRDGFESVTAMTPSELTRAIVQPALAVGLTIEPKLAAQVIADMRGEPGSLPLMQFALRDLLEAKNPQRGAPCELTLNDYLVRGGLQQALQRHADAAFAKLDAAQKPLVRGLFARLISPGRGTADTRRTVRLEQLVPAGQTEAHTQDLVQELADARLLTTSGDENGNARTVTIAHETLLEAWPWLVTLRRELRNEIELQNEISDDAAKWETNKRDSGFVYRDAQLASVTKTLDAGKLGLDALSMAFVKAGRKRQAQAGNLRRGIISALVVLTLAAMGLAGWAMRQQALSRSRELAVVAINEIQISPERALQIALVAEKVAHTFESENALRQTFATPLAIGLLSGHGDEVRSLEFSPDGKRLLSGSLDKTARLWDSKTGKSLAVLSGQGSIWNAQFSPDGRRIVTHGYDTVRLWDGEMGKPIATLNQHESFVSHPIFSPDSKRIVTILKETVWLWDGDTGRAIGVLRGPIDTVASVHFSRDSKRILIEGWRTVSLWDCITGVPVILPSMFQGNLSRVQFSPDGKRVVTSKINDKSAWLWNSETGEAISPLNDHESDVSTIVFSPDGQRIVTVGKFDKAARLWSGETGKAIGLLGGYEGDLSTIVFSPDSKRIVTAGRFDTFAQLWDGETGRAISLLGGHSRDVSIIVFSPNSKRIVTFGHFDKAARLWDSETGEAIYTLSEEEGSVSRVVFSPDGKLIATTSQAIRLWNSETGIAIATLKGHASNRHRGIDLQGIRNSGDWVIMEYSPDGKRLATTGPDWMIRLWDGESGNSVGVLDGYEGSVTSAQFSPDGTRILASGHIGSNQTGYIAIKWLWDVETRQLITALGRPEDYLSSAQFLANGQIVASSSVGDRLWDGKTGKPITSLDKLEIAGGNMQTSPDLKRTISISEDDSSVRLRDRKNGQIIALMNGHVGYVRSAVFSVDGKRVVTASEDHTARLWDGETGRPINILSGHEGIVSTALFSPDGKKIVTASDDGTARLWEGETGKLIMIMSGHQGSVTSARFSANGKRLVTSSDDETARVWEVETGRLIAVLGGHQNIVRSAQFSLDGRRIMTLSDNFVRLWDSEAGKLIAVIGGHRDIIFDAQFSMDGRRIVTTSADGTVRIDWVYIDDVITQAKEIAPRELTCRERVQYLNENLNCD